LRDYYSIPVHREIAQPFLQALLNSDVKWRGQASANVVSEDMVELAAESGCLDLALGIDSVCAKVLEIVNKRIDLKETRKFIHTLKKYRIGVKLNLILGLPGEPEDIVSQMVDFIDETGPRNVGLSIFCPFPGSKISDNYKDFGIRKLHPHLHEYHILYGRYDDMEKPRLMFEYDEVTPWGRGMKPEEIIENFNILQEILRKRHLIV